MAHHTLKHGYSRLVDRLNRYPQGAPPSKLLYKILKMLFSEKEASLVSLLPIKPFTARKAGHIWKVDLVTAKKALDKLADRAILIDIVMAIERGQFQDLIFDNRAMWSHRAMAAVLGVVLKLPPVKQALACRQVKSRFLEALIARFSV